MLITRVPRFPTERRRWCDGAAVARPPALCSPLPEGVEAVVHTGRIWFISTNPYDHDLLWNPQPPAPLSPLPGDLSEPRVENTTPFVLDTTRIQDALNS